MCASGDIYRFEGTGRFRKTSIWLPRGIFVTAILRRGVPKFSGQNWMNVTLCQGYPTSLADLTSVEECLIARCHPAAILVLPEFPNADKQRSALDLDRKRKTSKLPYGYGF